MQARDHPKAVWRWCLASAFRTALACTIVGCITLYGPASVQQLIAFPAFSYLTAILIVTDATLGDTLHGCWLVIYATVQSLGPAILSLWLIGPARVTIGTTSLAVALAAFVVALPEGNHLIAKRVGLGQIVLVYVVAFTRGEAAEPVMHPLHVAATTATGALASALALLLPYPRLACCEVKENCQLLSGNASERLKLYVKALCANENAQALASISQAKLIGTAGTKFLQSIRRYEESMKWEKFLSIIFRHHYYLNPGDKLQELETQLRGMELALTNMSSPPVRVMDEESKESLHQLEKHVSLNLKQVRTFWSPDSLTACESNNENIMTSLHSLQTIPTNQQDLAYAFFLFCMKLLIVKHNTSIQVNEESGVSRKQNGFLKSIWSNWGINLSSQKLMLPFKCSLSLGLAVLFGLIYNKQNAHWSGLSVAISISSAREATFKVANVKAQGTVLGTVYGVLGYFVFERFLPLRFLSLLPWFILTTFLRRSRLYGQAGGVSAMIGAILLLGRKNFGTPSEFAMARITETFIGLSCSVIVELLTQPTRAASLAKVQLSKTLGTIRHCVGSISLEASAKANMLENQTKLKLDISDLENFIGEAEVEPNFWFWPFHSACYGKLLGSLSRMADLLHFSTCAIASLEQESQQLATYWNDEFVKKLDGDLEFSKEMVGSLIKCFEDVTSLKSLVFLDREVEDRKISSDLEQGKSPEAKIFRISGSDCNETESIMASYFQRSKEVVDKIHGLEIERKKEPKSQMVLCLSALGFCMSNLIKETREIENAIIELVQWENPSSHINLYEISRRVGALHN